MSTSKCTSRSRHRDDVVKQYATTPNALLFAIGSEYPGYVPNNQQDLNGQRKEIPENAFKFAQRLKSKHLYASIRQDGVQNTAKERFGRPY